MVTFLHYHNHKENKGIKISPMPFLCRKFHVYYLPHNKINLFGFVIKRMICLIYKNIMNVTINFGNHYPLK